jgi:hypothetical protein
VFQGQKVHRFRPNYKAKDIIGKITNLFCIYLFQINKFINTYVLGIFFIVFVISLPTKLEIYYTITYLHNLR